MPTDENGDKWACESCIRGHRARTCEHFDRWMVMVKKPGRPLQECPHPRRDCNCKTRRARALMLSIKRDGKCLCQPKTIEQFPPVEPPPSQYSASSQVSPADYSHLPPSTTGPPPRQNGAHDSQSFHPQSSHPVAIQQYSAQLPSYPQPPPVPYGFPVQHNGQSQPPPLVIGQGAFGQPFSGDRSASDGNALHPWTAPPRQPERSCCAPRDPPTAEIAPEAILSTKAEITPGTENIWSAPKHGSLQAAGPAAALSSPETIINDKSKDGNKRAYSQMSEMPQTTVYHIPSSVATANKPMTTESLDALQKHDGYGRQTVPISAEFGIAGVAAPSAEASLHEHGDTTSHLCHCGDTCNCTACPVHPNNPTMQAKVQEMAEHLAFAGGRPHDLSRPPSSYDHVVSPTDSMHMSPIGADFLVDDHLDWSSPGSIVHNQHEAAFVTQAPHESTPTHIFSSGDYMHFQFNLPPLSDCTASPEVDCRCLYGCNCQGCFGHTGHIEDESVDGQAPPMPPV